jgi:Recombinase
LFASGSAISSSSDWRVLHHPRYAGAFCFGRSRQRKHPDGRHIFVRLAPEEWIARIRDAHDAYITWEEFEQNVQCCVKMPMRLALGVRPDRHAKVLHCCKA